MLAREALELSVGVYRIGRKRGEKGTVSPLLCRRRGGSRIGDGQRTLRDELEGRAEDGLGRTVRLLEEDLSGVVEVSSHELEVLDT